MKLLRIGAVLIIIASIGLLVTRWALVKTPRIFIGRVTGFKNSCASDSGACMIRVNNSWIDTGAPSGFPTPSRDWSNVGKFIGLTFNEKYKGQHVEVYANMSMFGLYGTLSGNKDFYIKLIE